MNGTSGLVKRFVEQMEKGKTNASTVECHSQVKSDERRKGTKILETKSENKVRCGSCLRFSLLSDVYLIARCSPEYRETSGGGDV